MTQELYDIGQAPPIGEVPAKMHAWLIREERFGEPKNSFKMEVVDVPVIADDEVLVYVMAAGVNYNNVWAGLGIPVNVIKARNKAGEPEDFHIGGSDASGVVYKVGRDVTHVKVGDAVVIHCGTWDRNCPHVLSGGDPMYSPTFRIWGYETNYGSFAQFTKVQAHQCMPKPKHMTWEAAAAYVLVGATAYRMLHGWSEHSIKQGDVALIWGGAGGLGSMAIQICKAAGATSVAVISNKNKIEYCEKLGAKGCIDRNEFDHWGMLPHWKDNVGYGNWLKGVRKFGAAIWEVLGDKRSPNLVFEHPGESTMPTSMFVCETGGSVVICAGTSGYNATIDLRYLWMRQKRVQGSHFANDEQSYAMNQLALDGYLDPCMSRAFTCNELPDAHQLMYENKHPHGNMSILIGAADFGQGATAKAPVPVSIDARSVPQATVHSTPNPFPADYALPGIDVDEETEPVMVDDGTKVKDLMFLGLISCRPEDSVATVARTMIGNDIHAVIVKEDDVAIGVVSQTDIVLARQGRSAEDLRTLTAREIMNPGCLTCDQETALSNAVTTMTKMRIHRLVVTENRDGHNVPVGIVSLTDVVRKLVSDS
ncbi:MAG: crotonyl-CoA carboxylase/reductase [Gammaproteobacteria bacterium]|nr:crotonyl-CoA carboxylase/reductase [Gammaproteobacteria bacterium]MCP5416574.1 crotonyl-CoA carboxylase/reductase [Chromatiaceae bacterium]